MNANVATLFRKIWQPLNFSSSKMWVWLKYWVFKLIKKKVQCNYYQFGNPAAEIWQPC